MAETMKAAVLGQTKRPLVIQDVPMPVPGPDELLVKLNYCGVCHSDLHIADGDWSVEDKLPLILGHEGIGKIVRTGEFVDNWKTGERVGIPLINQTCGNCDLCNQGVETLCVNIRLTGFHVPGCFAEYTVVNKDFAVPLPKSVTSENLAPILCAGVTVYRGLKQTSLKSGQWLSIWGIGGLGHVAVQFAKALGLKVIAIDIDNKKLEMASKLCADVMLNSREKDAIKEIKHICNGTNGALVTAPDMEAFQQAYEALKPNGVFTPLGICRGEFRTSIMDIMSRQITIKGSSVGTRNDMKECLEFATSHGIRPEVKIYDFDAVNNILDELRSNNINGRGVLRIN